MGYLGKQYLYNFLKEHGFSVDVKIEDTDYDILTNTEWLAFNVGNDQTHVCCINSQTICIRLVVYDFDEKECHDIGFYTFKRQENGEWQKTNERKYKY